MQLSNKEYDGTPFTHRGAAELEQVGILYVCISLGALVVAGVICALFGVEDAEFTDMIPAGEGIAMILLSKVFRYGAELRETAAQPPVPPIDRV